MYFASRKVEQQISTKDIDCKTIIFLRNDVYELLIDIIPDRGKEPKLILDCCDRDALTEIIRKRFIYSGIADETVDFLTMWRTIAVRHINCEESFGYILNRTLMRPRALIDCLKRCIGTAINRGNDKITESDIIEGIRQFSLDISQDISCEIRDVFPMINDKDALFMFIGEEQYLTQEKLNDIFNYEGVPEENWAKLTDFLLWYGILGLTNKSETFYIYDTAYNPALLKRQVKTLGLTEPVYTLYPTFLFNNDSF